MGTIIDIYQVIHDLITEARKQKNAELAEKLIDIEFAVSDLQKENSRLEEKLEQRENIIRHDDGPYVTLKNDPLKIHYCSTCWGNNEKLIQLTQEDSSEQYFECPICINNRLAARNRSK